MMLLCVEVVRAAWFCHELTRAPSPVAPQAAKKLDPTFLMRYAIFTREQQHTQNSASGAGGKGSAGAAATDLVSYVEFQRNYRCGYLHVQHCWHFKKG
jgi:hypothetical protein